MARIADRMNPVLLRELRRLSRNGFVIALVNLLLLGTLGLGIALLAAAVREKAKLEPEYCHWGYMALVAPVAVLGIPFMVFLRHQAQSRAENDDLVFVSALRPRQIVDGMALAGMAGMALVLSVTLPFAALALLISTADIGHLLHCAFLTAVLSCGACYAAVACASMRRSAVMRRLSFGISMLPFALAGFIVAFILPEAFLDSDDRAAITAITCASSAAAGLVARHLAEGELAPEHSNRYLNYHVAIHGAWAVMALAGFALVATVNEPDFALFGAFLTILGLGFLLLVSACSPPLRSEAVFMRMKAPLPGRFLRHLLYSGAERGMATCLLLIGLTLALYAALMSIVGRSYRWEMNSLCLLAGICPMPVVAARIAWRYVFARRAPHPAVTVLVCSSAFAVAMAVFSIMLPPGASSDDSPLPGLFFYALDVLFFIQPFVEASIEPPRRRGS